MQTAVKLYTPDIVASTTALQEPCICLIECQSALGLLIARSSTDWRRAVVLEDVTFLRVRGARYRYMDLGSVILKNFGDVWAAQDGWTREFLPEPSKMPYSVLYLTRGQHRHLEQHHAANRVEAVFQFCQPRFGSLPGFSYRDNLLETPEGYAISGADFSGKFLVPRAGN